MQHPYPPPPGPPPYPPGTGNVPPPPPGVPQPGVPQPGAPHPPYPPPPYGYGYPPPYFPPPAPPPPRVWPVFVAFVTAFIAGAIVSSIVLFILVFVLRRDEVAAADSPEAFQAVLESSLTMPGIFLPAIASTQVVLVAVSLAAAMLSPVPWKRRLRLLPARLPWYGYVVVILGTLALGFGSGVAIELLDVSTEGGALEMFEEALGGLRGWLLVAAALVVGVCPGFGEEMLFRGYMQTRLTRRWGRVASILVVSLLFGLMHMDLVQGTFVILLGLYLGELTERTGSIWPAIICHTINNSLSTLVAPLAESEIGMDPATEQGAMALWITLGVCAVVLTASLIYVMRRPLVPVEEGPPREEQEEFQVLPYAVPQPQVDPQPPYPSR